jgi:hypothetical protein
MSREVLPKVEEEFIVEEVKWQSPAGSLKLFLEDGTRYCSSVLMVAKMLDQLHTVQSAAKML